MLSLLLSYAPGGADDFAAGFYRFERRGHVPVPVRAWFGPPADPNTGEQLERSWRWQFEFAGLALETYAHHVGFEAESILAAFWPASRDNTITRSEYEFLLDTAAWARANDPASPFSSARGKVDLLSASLPEF